MNTITKTVFAALVLLFAISCEKEKSIIQPSPNIDESATQSLTDIQNAGIYPSVKIGTQKWMTKNLDVPQYRNGDKIPEIKNRDKWAALTTGAWCWYNNDSATYAATYGRLYNWYAVNDPRGLAPTGWHVPSDAEWTTLTTFLGGVAVAGGKMKETGIIHWLTPNTDATNSSGFTGLPGGYRYVYGTFYYVGLYSYWWSSTEVNDLTAWFRNVNYSSGYVGQFTYVKKDGFSVRCLKD